MDFINETNLPADLFRAAAWEDEILAMVVARATYRVGADGKLDVDDNPFPILLEPLETPFGTLPNDIAPQKKGVDLLVLGQAYAQGGKPVDKMLVSLQVGNFKRALAIVGDRIWQKSALGLAPTPPKLFLTMPVTHERAYGGKAMLQKKEIPNGYNPVGRGYILDKDEADGVLLPNIEDPHDIITSWESKPIPAGFAPIPLATQFVAERGVEEDPKTKQVNVKPEFFNCAHPKMIIPELKAGDQVTLTGMTPEGVLRFTIPEIPLQAELSLEEQRFTFPMRVDSLGILPEERRLFLTLRAGFKYRFIPEQVRVIRVQHAEKAA